jgi:hypothetical protein
MFSSPFQVTPFPLKKTKKETKLGDINVKLTSKAKCFHKKIMACNPYKCTTPNPQKIVIEHH